MGIMGLWGLSGGHHFASVGRCHGEVSESQSLRGACEWPPTDAKGLTLYLPRAQNRTKTSRAEDFGTAPTPKANLSTSPQGGIYHRVKPLTP